MKFEQEHEETEIKIDIEIVKVSHSRYVALIYRGNALIYRLEERNREQAVKRARRDFWRMMRCSHVLEFDISMPSYPVDRDDAGNEIYGYEATCPKCGYIDQYFMSHRGGNIS